jgi:hypothetical protein
MVKTDYFFVLFVINVSKQYCEIQFGQQEIIKYRVNSYEIHPVYFRSGYHLLLGKDKLVNVTRSQASCLQSFQNS